MTDITVARKPFHKAIVDQIHLVASFDGRLELIGLILNGTIIPDGHDEIIEAWRKRCANTFPPPPEHEKVVEGLLAHKQEMALQKAKNGGKEVDLNSLDWEAEQLHYYIANPEPDSEQWKQSLQDTIQNLHKLTSQALGK